MTNYGPNVKDKGRSRCKVECSKRDDLKDDTHRRPQHREVHRMHRRLHRRLFKLKYTQTRPILVPSSKKTTFCRNFPFEDLELSIFCHIFALRKTFTHTHSQHPSTQTIECFSRVRDIYQAKGEFNDRGRKTKNWNVSRHRHEHNT